MSWYYAQNDDRRGPVEDAEFQSLVSDGTIRPDTLVWREGFTDWVAYQSVASRAGAVSTSPAGAAAGVSTGQVACSQCGRPFPADAMITFEGRNVCAECKPLFFQRVKEGATFTGAGGDRQYAGFWIRFCAKFVDGIILQIAGFITGLIIGLVSAAVSHEASTMAQVLSTLAGLLINATYAIYFISQHGATPGKMACGLQVIRADDSPMTVGVATGRYFAEILSALTLFIGYIMVAFDDEKRALHDRICDTRVIRKANR